MMTEADRVRKYEDLANGCLKKVDKALRQPTLPSAPRAKFLDAVQLWHRAGRFFSVSGEWEDAAISYGRAADMMTSIGCVHEAAVYSLKAGEMMARIDPAEAVDRYHNAVSLYCEIGRFYTAANIQREVARMLEDDDNLIEAMEHYRQAADYYFGDNFADQAIICLREVARIAASLEKFDYATETLEKVAQHSIDQNLLRLNIPNIFLRAGLCQLAAGGPIRKGLKSHKVLKYYLKKWSIIDYAFEFSREHLFLSNLLAIIPKHDMDAFADHVYNFDNVAGLDYGCLLLLNRVREDIQEELDRLERLRIKEELRAKRLEEEGKILAP